VSLEAVKGESGLQRRQRIDREKAAAQGRRCDFCGPASGDAVASNGTAESAPAVDVLVPGDGVVDEANVVEVVEPLAEQVEAPVNGAASAAGAEGAQPVQAPRRARRARRASRAPVRFRVNYLGVRELEATDILAAVARAEAMGVRDIVAVTRIG
jgi:hypothetical protein